MELEREADGLLLFLVVLLLVVLVLGEVLLGEGSGGDVDKVLERALVLLGDLLAQDLVVPEGAEPEVGDALRRLLVRVVPIFGLCVDVLLALDDGRALGVEGGVELGVPLLQLALLLEELAVELVVFALRLGQRVDASANLPMQGLDETAAHPDEIVELVLERADEPGVVAKLAEGLEHLSLVDMGELRVFWGDGGTVRVCTWGLDLGGHFAAADGGNKKGKMMCLKTHVRVVRVVLVGEGVFDLLHVDHLGQMSAV